MAKKTVIRFYLNPSPSDLALDNAPASFVFHLFGVGESITFDEVARLAHEEDVELQVAEEERTTAAELLEDLATCLKHELIRSIVVESP